MTWYSFFKTVSRGIASVTTRLEVQGRENIPTTGPFFLVPNHQSLLDPVLVQVSCPRPVHSFTKSTQFGSAFFRWFLPRVNAIPTRRYRVDPHVVRVALRLLDNGEGVAIYPEGERSWDGSLQPLRHGTVRLLLKAGVPVIPCGLVGAFDVWPRWSKRPRRQKVVVRFGTPIEFGRHDSRAERDAVLHGAISRLQDAMDDVSRPHPTAVAPRGTHSTQSPPGARPGSMATER